MSDSEISVHLHQLQGEAPAVGNDNSSADRLTVEQQQQVDICGWTGRARTPTVWRLVITAEGPLRDEQRAVAGRRRRRRRSNCFAALKVLEMICDLLPA